MRSWIAIVAAACIGVGLGLALGASFRGDDVEATAPDLRRLEAELADASAENTTLSARIELLESRIAENPVRAEAGQPGQEEGPGEAGGAEAAENDSGSEAGAAAAGDETSAFDAEKLLALGFYANDVERLRRAWEELELERLYIQDARARSTDRDGRFWQRLIDLEAEAIADLGEQDYDALLYASGARNRVRVRNVLPGSAAEVSGLSPRDEITHYDDASIFRMQALKRGTLDCEAGTQVAVDIREAEGGVRRVWVPCGPLGIELEMVNVEPR